MTGHDLMAAAVAQELIRQSRQGSADWVGDPVGRLSPTAFVTGSRTWPVPDFVISDPATAVTLAAEFKPPDQTKREYLTGLGQAVAYTRGFHFGLLVLPDRADDGYRIGDHVADVLGRPELADVPVGVARYDPAACGPNHVALDLIRPLPAQVTPPPDAAAVEQSLFAKFREASPNEIGLLLQRLYEQRGAGGAGGVRQRAFDLLWADIQAGKVVNSWARRPRKSKRAKSGVYKNYTNFLHHLGWIEPDGSLTTGGLKAHDLFCLYGDSVVFRDHLGRTLLTAGKHLILLSAITDIQNTFLDAHPTGFDSEDGWLDHLETELDRLGSVR